MNELFQAPAQSGRVGDWMQTYTGLAFYPLDPRPSEINIADIAAGLSKMCRYGGQCTRFYSVAEHSVLVAEKAPDEFKLDALMHDASEAYLSDVIRPIKSSLTNYLQIEERLQRTIAERFALRWPMPARVKILDNAILADERNQNMARPPQPWHDTGGPLGVELHFWTPAKASYEFLTAFYRYGGHYV